MKVPRFRSLIFMSSWHDEIIRAGNKPLPNLRAEFTSSRRHPFPRVVHALANLPSWNIFHDPGLLLKILLPLFDKSTIVSWTMDLKSYIECRKKYHTDYNDRQHWVVPFILFSLEHRQYSTTGSDLLFFECTACKMSIHEAKTDEPQGKYSIDVKIQMN